MRALIAGALSAAALSSTHAAAGAPEHRKVVIGASAALTGAGSQQARAFHDGARLYFNRVNAAGGLHGHRIELQVLDDRGDPSAAAANTRKLLDMGAVCLFGYTGAPQVAAAHPLARESGALLFAPLTGTDELHGPQFPNVYTLRPGYAEEAAAVARQVEQVGMRRVAVLHTGDAEARAALAAVHQAFARLGAPVTHALLSDPGAAATIDQAVAAHPEAVVVIADTSGSAVAVRYLRARKFHGPIYALSAAGESLLADALGREGEGVVVTRLVPRADANALAPVARRLLADAAAADAGPPNVHMLEGYIAAHALVEALRGAAPEFSRGRLRHAVETSHEQDIGGFRIRFGKDRMGSRRVELGMIDAWGRVRE